MRAPSRLIPLGIMLELVTRLPSKNSSSGRDASAGLTYKLLTPRRFDRKWIFEASADHIGDASMWRSIVSRISRRSAAGGTPVTLEGDSGYQDASSWSPDGQSTAFIAVKAGDWSLVKARVGGGALAPVVLKTGIPPYVARPQSSPDGQWIACETTEGLTLVSPDGLSSRVISDRGWLAYGWAGDSFRLYGSAAHRRPTPLHARRG